MILKIQSKSGGLAEIALDPARGDGVGLQVSPPDGYVEPIPLGTLTALVLDADDVNPVVTATFGGRFQTPYSVNPESVVHVGYEDPATPIGANHGRSASFTISELAGLTVDLDRLVVG